MKCAYCTHFEIDQHARMFNEGYGLCQGFQKIRAMFVSIKKDSDCSKFKQTTEAVIEKRRQKWRSK